jgi:hypothetical protein
MTDDVEQVDDVPPMETCLECGVTSSGGWAHTNDCSYQTIKEEPTP